MKNVSLAVGILTLGALTSVAQSQQQENTQQCNPLIDATTPASRYAFNAASGVALDERFNLMWQRCPLGYTLDDGGTSDFLADDQCTETDETAFEWGDALLAAQAHNSGGGLGGFSNWRLPDAHELATIVERQCHHPALNLEVFPSTGDFLLLGGFWSATPELEQGFAFVGPRARGWNFRLGTAFRSAIDPGGPFGVSPQAVRLVRDP